MHPHKIYSKLFLLDKNFPDWKDVHYLSPDLVVMCLSFLVEEKKEDIHGIKRVEVSLFYEKDGTRQYRAVTTISNKIRYLSGEYLGDD